METVEPPTECGDRGFTLVELLIVIVVLGVLATVTVFAVRGITNRGQENACAVEIRNLATAQETHWALTGSYATEADLVADGTITEASTMYDVTLVGADGYSITPAPGSSCTASDSGGGSGASPAPAPPAPPGPITPTSINFGGFSAWQYGATGADEVVVFGRTAGENDWLAMINAAPPTSRRVTFINLDEVGDSDDLDAIMSRARTNGITAFGLYPADDTVPLLLAGGGTAPSVGTYVLSRVAPDPYYELVGPGAGIFELLFTLG